MGNGLVVQEIKAQDPKQKPGFIEFKYVEGQAKLDDLWFMVGSRCNLSCRHCYVASSPTNDTLEQINSEDIKPFLEEGKKFNMNHVYFTGGEPFINQDMMNMIKLALDYADVTILTNATFPITRFIPELKKLNDESENELSFRVSADHYEEAKHDAIRGEGNFRRTFDNVKTLYEAGFKPIITASGIVYENNPLTPEQIEQKFIEFFKEEGIDIEVKLLPFTLEMGTNLERLEKQSKHTFISENCMTLPPGDPANFQCHNGRTVEKIKGHMKVYPCPIIYNDSLFELADTLEESFQKVYLTHKACFDFCYKAGGKCTN